MLMPWVTGCLQLGAFATLVWWIARHVLQDRALAWIAIGGLTVRAAVAMLLYFISAAGLPVAGELQLGGGFWSFAPDARHYHQYAVGILDAWRDGVELPSGLESGFYFLVLAVTYGVLGAHPLHGAWVNAGVGGLSSLLAYSMARRVGDARAGRICAALVAFWPSLILWSSQLLKEEITIFMVLAALQFTQVLLHRAARDRDTAPRKPWEALLLLAGVSVATMLVAMARPVYSLALGLCGVIVFGVVAAMAARRGEFRSAGGAAAAGVLIVVSALVGQVTNPLYFFAAAAPWEGRYALGVAQLERGHVVAARKEFARALELKPDFAPARDSLARLTAEATDTTTPLALARAARGGTTVPGRGAAVWRSSLERGKVLAAQIRNLPVTLSGLRSALTIAGGSTPIDPDLRFSSFGDVLRYLPTASAYFFLSPFPWQPFPREGVAGRLRAWALVETALLYVLIPFGAIGGWRLLRARNPAGWMLLLYLFVGSAMLGLIVIGLGSLFRYRLAFLVPLMVVGSVGLSAQWTRSTRDS